MRRLPVYIVVDTSESMIGEAIDQINVSLDRMLSTLYRNPYALETVWLSLLTFDSQARVAVPLTELMEFRLPKLQARPGTALGAAVDLLQDRIEKEVEKANSDQKGDWRPIVFLLTDGQPTDKWRSAVKRLKTKKPRPGKIYAIGVGDEVDFGLLREIGDVTLRADSLTVEKLADLFVWMSASIQSASRAAAPGKYDDAAPLPEGVTEVGDDFPEAPDFPLQYFFHFTCVSTQGKYMARYHYQKETGLYRFVKAYPVPDDFTSGSSGSAAPQADATKIEDLPTCPYCGRTAWFVCRCGANLDLMEAGESCPHCGAQVAAIGDYDGSSVGRSRG